MRPEQRSLRYSGRSTRAEIDMEAFASNLALARRLAGEKRGVMAVVKADGYGHGAVALARLASAGGAASLGVATLAEARALREHGVTLPIVILSEIAPACADETVILECTPVVYSLAVAEALAGAAHRAGRRLPVHLKVDTGMGRVGVSPGEALSFARRLSSMPYLLLEGLLSHLAEADVPGSAFTEEQVARFCRLAGEIEGELPELSLVHIANSALLMNGRGAGNLVRPGIMLYGSPPAPGFPGGEALRAVMRLVTAVAFLKRVPAGTPLSYGRTFVTRRESLVATLPVGYADGYSRLLSNKAEVLVRGRRVPQVGRVCMDMCLADVTDVPGVAAGDEVVLLGRQGGEEVTAEELAEKIGTISYEVYCAVAARVPRIYRDASAAGAGAGGASDGEGR